MEIDFSLVLTAPPALAITIIIAVIAIAVNATYAALWTATCASRRGTTTRRWIVGLFAVSGRTSATKIEFSAAKIIISINVRDTVAKRSVDVIAVARRTVTPVVVPLLARIRIPTSPW
jgi:hypothetical protein